MKHPKERTCKTCGLALPKRNRPRHDKCSVCRKLEAGVTDSSWDNHTYKMRSILNRNTRLAAQKGSAA